MSEDFGKTAFGQSVRLGVSSCLLGEMVRFNGGHTRDNFLVQTLGTWVEWVSVCPELEMGLGVPRESLRLIGDRRQPRLIAPKSGADHTEGMTEWSHQKLRELAEAGLHGFILKRASPSCGLFRVKVYDENTVPSKDGRGIFANLLAHAFPMLPLEEEGRLNDPRLRENFIERIFAYQRWRELEARASVPALVEFHRDHKLTLMAHSPSKQVELGRLLADTKSPHFEKLMADYGRLFMNTMAIIATPKRHTNVLQHIQGFFKKEMSDGDKQELVEVIEEYRLGRVPLVVPLTLFRHHLRHLTPTPWLQSQTYLYPYPRELMLRNHV